ncbi:MAG: hypothetical protein EPO32_01415 [Anaerolineae bacterium]|nr:MAG: hypothetical protein EPO32_01415 [Anaerolineae bacterium]
MVYILILWGYAFGLLFLYGHFTWQGVKAGFQIDTDLPVVLKTLLGFVPLTAGALVWNYFYRVGSLVNAVMVLGALMGAILMRHSIGQAVKIGWATLKSTPWWITGLIAMMLFVVVYRAAYFMYTPDTGLYHAQAVRWAEEYAVVPGLGNLHGRLATNSSWFITAALLGYSTLSVGLQMFFRVTGGAPFAVELQALLFPFHPVNSLLIGLMIFHGFSAMGDWVKGARGYGVFLRIVAAVAAFYLYLDDFAAPNPDVPAALFLWLTILSFTYWIERKHAGDLDENALLVMFFGVFAVTVKLSALPVLILPLYLVVHRWRKGWLWLSAGLLVLFFLPWLGRYYVLSGYLVFPLEKIDLFNPDWKMGMDAVQDIREWILSWGRIPVLDKDDVLAMPLTTWVPIWWGNLRIYVRVLLYLSLGASAFAAVRLFLDARANRLAVVGRASWGALMVALWCGMAYWFFSAPDPRFVMGFLLPLLGVMLLYVAGAVRETGWFGWVVIALAAGVAGLWGLKTTSSVWQRRGEHSAEQRFIAPIGYVSGRVEGFVRDDVVAHEINGYTVFLPREGEDCWYAPLPCVVNLKEAVYLRGDTLQEGFRLNPKP